MLFNSFTYLVFLPIVVILYWTLPELARLSQWRRARSPGAAAGITVFDTTENSAAVDRSFFSVHNFRICLLLAASYIFYMNWKPAYGILIFALTLINYFLGLLIDRAGASRRKLVLTIGLFFNLACLCFFKYATFLIDSVIGSVSWLTAWLGHPTQITSPALHIILPLGISFFTFEFIHYITDVYRGSKPVGNFRDFALFAAFFPSQIAGPIKRFQDFVHQLTEAPRFTSENFKEGMFLILQGLFKKIVLGDNLSPVVAHGFTHISDLTIVDAWIAVAGFTFQIFFDFSGYTDIGRGSALLLGYKVPENFNWPFLAANLTDFWRRWHISLSTWLRDYLFIPLGGSRGNPWKVRFNVMLTMVLGGLWHGAAWHYVIWGAFHGSGLVLSKEWQDLVSRVAWLSRLRPHPLWHWSGVAMTMFFLFLAGILFRAEDIPQALAITQKLAAWGAPGEVTRQFWQSTLPLTLSIYLLFLTIRQSAQRLSAVPHHPLNAIFESIVSFWNASLPARLVSYCSAAIVILAFAPLEIEPFIYFQF